MKSFVVTHIAIRLCCILTLNEAIDMDLTLINSNNLLNRLNREVRNQCSPLNIRGTTI